MSFTKRELLEINQALQSEIRSLRAVNEELCRENERLASSLRSARTRFERLLGYMRRHDEYTRSLQRFIEGRRGGAGKSPMSVSGRWRERA